MRFFVMEYDRKKSVGHWTEFGVIDDALASLRTKEASRSPEVEVVLLMGRSLDDLKMTHGRYFMSPMEMVERWQQRTLVDGLISAG